MNVGVNQCLPGREILHNNAIVFDYTAASPSQIANRSFLGLPTPSFLAINSNPVPFLNGSISASRLRSFTFCQEGLHQPGNTRGFHRAIKSRE